MKNNRVLTVVVTFNRKELLLECLTALSNQEQNTDILVVDNASTDGTKDYIAHLIENQSISYVNTGANLGGAGGFNFALREAYRMDYDYFWLMDDDTIVQPGSLSALLRAAKSLNNDFGFLSSFVRFIDGETCKMNIQTLNTQWYHGLEKDLHLLRADKATFVSFFVKKETLGVVGLPIKEFFIWADDSEFSQRISKQYPSYMVIDSLITHKMLANADANYKVFLNESTDRYKRYYYSFRNNFYIAKQSGVSATAKHIVKLLAIACLSLTAAKHFRFSKMGIVFKGFWDGIFFNPKIEYLEDN